jgi:hypothetical protein
MGYRVYVLVLSSNSDSRHRLREAARPALADDTELRSMQASIMKCATGSRRDSLLIGV